MDREASLEAFGQRVRAARHAQGWTQEQLSRNTGLAVVQVSRIERGKREVRLTTVLRLIAALQVTPDDLLGGIDPPEQGPIPST